MWSTVWESLVQAETLSFCGIWTLKYLMVDITVSQTINSSTLYETKTMTSGFSLYHQKLGKIWVAEYQTLGPLGYKIYYKGTLFIVCLITYNISVSLSWPESACFWKSLHYKLNYHLQGIFFLAWPQSYYIQDWCISRSPVGLPRFFSIERPCN